MKMAGPDPGKVEVDDYLAAVAEPARSTLSRVRAVIRAAAPKEATEAISYRMPVFKYKGLLIGYAAFPKHCGLYVMSPAVMELFQKELEGMPTSKGTIRFPLDQPLPSALIKKLVAARVEENERLRAK